MPVPLRKQFPYTMVGKFLRTPFTHYYVKTGWGKAVALALLFVLYKIHYPVGKALNTPSQHLWSENKRNSAVAECTYVGLPLPPPSQRPTESPFASS